MDSSAGPEMMSGVRASSMRMLSTSSTIAKCGRAGRSATVELHVVAQVVEAELVVRAVGDVARVGDLPLGVVQVVLDDADRHAEEAVDAAHPFRVAARQVVVDRDDVHALARERVQVGRQRRHERLAFARLHLGDAAVVQHHAADELHVEVPHVEHAASRFAHDRERFRQQLVQRGALGDALAKACGLDAQIGVRERPESSASRR